jgi:phospholipid/cholesterol/gamma-HCH transport system substrate-binding protein
VLAIVVVAVLIMSSRSSYQVKAVFQNASQIVSGNQVEVAGNVVGSVSKVDLTPDNQAQLTLTITNSNYKPLHQGTIATVRLSSLSGLANRYIDLRLGPGGSPSIPNGGVIPTTNTTSAVDLDELFNTLNQSTLRGLKDVIQGSASQYDRQGAAIQAALAYLNPSLVATATEFREINRDTPRFTNFIVKTEGLVTDLASRSGDLSGLIQHLSTVTEALAAQQRALGESIRRLPDFMRLADTTFVNLRAALRDLTPLINASKPVVLPVPGYPRLGGRLRTYLEQLKPLAEEASCAPLPNATCTVRNLANLICSQATCTPQNPGQNDLILLTKLGVPLAAAACGDHGPRAIDCLGKVLDPRGKLRSAAFPVSVTALNDSSPEIAVDRPYSIDLTGWFEGYSHTGLIDANGGAARIESVFGLQSLGIGGPTPIAQPGLPALGPLAPVQSFLAQLFGAGGGKGALTTGYGDRCPGSIERGGTWKPSQSFPCDQSEGPTGG